MKHYLLPEKGSFYKANLHMHTTLSDGKMTPEETKEEFQKRGYSVVAFTDHEVMIPHPELTDESFLALTSYEIAVNGRDAGIGYDYVKTYHLNLYAKEMLQKENTCFSEKRIWVEHSKKYIPAELRGQVYDMEYSAESVNRMIETANKEGYLVSYNHPVWSNQSYEDYGELKGLWGVEYLNYGCDRVGNVDTMQPIDDLLRKGERVFPLATDDAHSLDSCFGGFVMIKAEKLEYAEIMHALRVGNFYASGGPEISSLTLEDGVLKVQCSPAQAVCVSTDRRFARRVNDPACKLTEAEFNLNGYFQECKLRNPEDAEPYFRVTVVGPNGRTAQTRAFFFDEFQEF